MFFSKKKTDKAQHVNSNHDEIVAIRAELDNALRHLAHNSNDASTLRARIASAISGGYDYSDTMHNVFLDFGYPMTVEFHQAWNMYRRFGIAKNVVDLPVDIGWVTLPEIEGPDQLKNEIEILVKKVDFWKRIKGLDKRQRVGRYAGMFMRVKDGLSPEIPIDGKLNGVASLSQIIPLYEGQLKVLETDTDPLSENYGMPVMYQFNSGEAGNRNEKEASSFNIHPSRLVIAAEGSDNGGIYGISSLEAPFNSLMDLRKIIGAGGEGFYRNAAQSVLFNVKDMNQAANNKALLEEFQKNHDDFLANRQRRSLWTPGMEAKVLESSLADPKNHFSNALNDVAAACGIPATILIGQQTGRLASDNDSEHFLTMVQSRRENFVSEMIKDIIEWMMANGVLVKTDFEIEWDDLISNSDSDKLDLGDKMATINEKLFRSGGNPAFTEQEIRDISGYESDPNDIEDDIEDDELLPEDMEE